LARLRPVSERRYITDDDKSSSTSCWLSTLWAYTNIMSTDSEKHVEQQPRLERALAAVQAGDLESARRQFEELVMDDPRDPLALYNLGLCYNEAGSYEAARKTLLKCLELDPSEANTYVALGLAEAKLGQMADAEAHLVQAVAIEPGNPYALRNLASVHAATKRLPQALKELLRVDAILHDDPPTVYGLGLVYRTLGRPMEATKSFQRCAALADASYAEMARNQLREIAEESFKSSGLRMDAVQFCYEALTRFDAMTDEAVQAVVCEIALLGRHGLDPQDAERKYSLDSMAGRFSGLQLVCFLYVGMKRVALEQDIGFDLSSEYDVACAWRKEPRA
jgi:tetratricopeptide (TPR) repeat protein